jgi:coenzyme F420 hydrogenase subunit delta
MHISHKKNNDATLPSVVVFGCGNTLLGDDGFGPAVIEALQACDLPETVHLVDAGTGIREYLLDYLMLPALRPQLIIVVDAGCADNGVPGQLRECAPADISARKVHDFSLHQFPTVNLLQELQEETGIAVRLLIAPAAILPDRIAPGLSPEVRGAVDAACRRILRIVNSYTGVEAAVS